MDDAGFEKGPYLRHCTLCLMRSAEVESFLHPFSKKGLTIGIDAAHGFLRLAFKGEPPVVDGVMKAIEERFATFFVGDSTVEEAIHLEMISQKKNACPCRVLYRGSNRFAHCFRPRGIAIFSRIDCGVCQ